MRNFVFVFVLSSWLVVGCGGNGSGGGATVYDLATNGTGGNGSGGGGGARDMTAGGAADLAPGGSSVLVVVPASFTGAPRQLLVAAFDSLPVTGPPAGILYEADPTLTAGASLQLPIDATGLSGTKQVLAVLYMQGGGQFSPTAGIDYESQAVTATFPGTPPLDLGTLTLALVQ
jgi:hypothetical protein